MTTSIERGDIWLGRNDGGGLIRYHVLAVRTNTGDDDQLVKTEMGWEPVDEFRARLVGRIGTFLFFILGRPIGFRPERELTEFSPKAKLTV